MRRTRGDVGPEPARAELRGSRIRVGGYLMRWGQPINAFRDMVRQHAFDMQIKSPRDAGTPAILDFDHHRIGTAELGRNSTGLYFTGWIDRPRPGESGLFARIGREGELVVGFGLGVMSSEWERSGDDVARRTIDRAIIYYIRVGLPGDEIRGQYEMDDEVWEAIRRPEDAQWPNANGFRAETR
jgi:hypothetical protein